MEVMSKTKQAIAKQTMSALEKFNSDFSKQWDFGTNWSNVDTMFETFVNKYLFPKINSTDLINTDLGNRFDWLADEVEFIGQYNEEYVILDTVPVNLNLNREAELMLKRNYPKMATKLYEEGIVKKVKFTLNNNDVRLNFLTLGDGINYALGVYRKRISDINVSEEKEVKGMLLDYALNHTNEVRDVASFEDIHNQIFQALLNIQNNSEKYNESNQASNGTIGRYTTYSPLENVAILTTDKVKTYLLNTNLANTFQVKGLDLTNKIISFDDLGGNFKTTDDITIESDVTLKTFEYFGDYQARKGEVIPKGVVFTFDVSELEEFKGKVEEIKPEDDLFAYIFDIRKVRYKRYTKDMLKEPFYNGEFDEVTYWLHYYSSKAVSPFYNNVRIGK